ncbi:MAG: hypothetical protein HQK77_22300 [Desulfobacterales bacterium]|nr:hypothetical protein [Desulfobacterales bacterium]
MKFKRRPDLDNLTRLQIAVQAFLCQGVYGEITRLSNFYKVSRLFVYKLLWQLIFIYELEVTEPVPQKSLCLEIDRAILLLRLEGHCSLESISQIIKQLGMPFSSISYISQRLTDYACRLPENTFSGNQILFLLCDEIFTLGRPILLTVEPRSLTIIKIELVKKRDAETWKSHWEEMVSAGFITNPTIVSDQGTGIVKGCALMGLSHHPDLFHLLQNLSGIGTRLYRKALSAIEREYDRSRVFESGKTETVLQKRLSEYESAQSAADQHISRYDNFCYLWRELRMELEVFDMNGNIQMLSLRQEKINIIIELMHELDDEKLKQGLKNFVSGLEGYWGYYERMAEVYREFMERFPSEVIRWIAVGWQLQKQGVNNKDYGVRKRLTKEAAFYFEYADILIKENYPPSSETIRDEVIKAFDGEVRSSSLVENVNSSLRQFLETCRGQVNQGMLNLFAYVHNHRPFVRGKRSGYAPIEILTGKKMETTWLESLLNAA